MLNRHTILLLVVLVVVSATPVLAGCGATAPPTTAPTKAAPTAVPSTPVPPTPKGPTVGGKLVVTELEPNTLDAHKAISGGVLFRMGSYLVQMSPDGKYTPDLAEGWKVSTDGLVWDFAIRKDAKFHDGSPLTAKDFAWSYQRVKDPATKAGVAGRFLTAVDKIEAVDEYTLRLTLPAPSFPLLYGLTYSYMQPLSKAAVEKRGDQYGQHPVGVGPYKFKEWLVGDRIVLERNPDFNWGPAFAKNRGPYYIQTYEVRFIPELSTIVAGLETDEISYTDLPAREALRLKSLGKHQVFSFMNAGFGPGIWLNVTKQPYDDVRVRKALNLAVDRQALVDVVTQGTSAPLYGPLSNTVIGYWQRVEKIGYKFDLAQAKSLMKDAGYTADSQGMLSKGGQQLKLTIHTVSEDILVKTAEMLKEQYKALGVEIEIKVVGDSAMWVAQCRGGGCDMSLYYVTGAEADLLYLLHHSKAVGTLNFAMVKDPELDRLLEATRTTTDPEKRQAVVNDAQKHIVEQAYLIPLFAKMNFLTLTNRVKGAVVAPGNYPLYLQDAYFEAE